MYPFSTRLRWLAAGRYAHILKAAELHRSADSLVGERLTTLRRWNTIHLVVGTLLLFGILGSVATTAANIFPELGGFWGALRDAAAAIGAFTGILTLAYLGVNRLLSQIEADVIMLMLTRRKNA